MKLKDLAEVFRGASVNPTILNSQGGDYLYLTPEALSRQGEGRYISDKAARKAELEIQRLELRYGDYLFFLSGEDIRLHRYVHIGKSKSIPSDDFVILRTDSSYLTNYFTFDSNKKDTNTQIQRNLEKSNNLLAAVLDVELSSLINELDAPVPPEYAAIREPIDISSANINIIQKPMSIDVIIQRMSQENSEINLFTEFQRKAGLWTSGVKSRFIESIIVGLPVPAFYFDTTDNSCWLVVDGIQRLSAIKEFVIDKTLRLSGLDYLGDLEGKSYDELGRPEKRNIHEFEILSYLIRPGTHPGIKYRIFKSLNTSGLILERQEIRHAVNPGKPAEFLKEFSTMDIFQKMLKIGDAKKDRMEDREQALRYIAFRNQHFLRYKPEMMDYLDEAMTRIYDIHSDLLSRYKQDLSDALELLRVIFPDSENVFNKTAFGVKDRNHVHNSAVFEILTVCLSELTIEEKEKIRNNPSSIRQILQGLNQNEQFLNAIDPTNAWTKTSVEERFKTLTKLFKEWLSNE
jgi:hypothetical protein